MNPNELIEKLEWRYATKKFDPTRKVPDDAWKALEQSIVLSPSSFGLQPWRFYDVSDKALRTKLRAVSWNQSQIEDASHLVVFASRVGLTVGDVDRHLKRIVEVRQVTPESLDPYRSAIVAFIANGGKGFDVDGWTRRQTYIAIGFFLSAAAMLGIDACPMEGMEPAKYDEILGISKEGYSTLSAVAVGYRASDDAYAQAKKVRFPSEHVLHRR